MSQPQVGQKRPQDDYDTRDVDCSKRKRLETMITNQEYNKVCLDPFDEDRKPLQNYEYPRHVKFQGLAQTDAVPARLVTAPLKARECLLEMERALNVALEDYCPFDDWWEDSYTCAQTAARAARMAQLHQLGITEKGTRTARTSYKPDPGSTTTLQAGSRLLSLPTEIRSIIWRYTFSGGGNSYIMGQLGHLRCGQPKYLSTDLALLRTCRRLYSEALQIANRGVTIFHFSECRDRSLLKWLEQPGPHRIAVWVNPYDPTTDRSLFKRNVSSITFCSNFVSIPLSDVAERWWAEELVKVAQVADDLQELRVLTGSPLARPSRQRKDGRSKVPDGCFAWDLRKAWNRFAEKHNQVGLNLQRFMDAESSTTTNLRFCAEDSGKDKTVVLSIASIWETENC